jgi:hypothetical protein
MAPRKRGRKRPARKSKRTTAPAARPRPGHNKPPESPPPQPAVPDMRSWQGDDQTAANIVRQVARQRARHTAYLGGMSVGPPLPLSSPPSANTAALHQQMLKRVAALEEMLARLPPPRPLDDDEIEELGKELARLKASPTVPTPTVIATESPLRKFGEKILTQWAVQQGTAAAKAVGKELWKSFGDELIEAAKVVADWIASVL